MIGVETKLRLVFPLAIIFFGFSVHAQHSYWKKVKPAQQNSVVIKSPSTLYELNMDAMANLLSSKSESILVDIPDLSGEIIQYHLKETPVLHPILAKKYPGIKSFTGWSLDGGHKVRVSFSHKGIQVMQKSISAFATKFIERDRSSDNLYRVFSKSVPMGGFQCRTPVEVNAWNMISKTNGSARSVDDQTLRKYRIAVSATGEYTDYHGGTVADALAAINATITRVNEVFETDFAITLEVVANNDQVIFTNANTDPYGDNLDSEVQNVLTTTIGEANYDVGHVFQRGENNGFAGGIGTVCRDQIKGSAFSTGEPPEGDRYDIDYVAHELGHQFGANHTFSFNSEGTGVQAEPGSGTTIMAYAGITGADDVAPNSDDYFHYNSIQQVFAYVRTQSCAQESALANNVPTIDQVAGHTIPMGTAFVLTGSASDTDTDDELTYTWEQIDNGLVTAASFGPENTTGANFRSLPPTNEPSRYFPRLSRILDGELTETTPTDESEWETVSNVARDLNFALTVRDNAMGGGQVASETLTLNVIDTAGPFRILSQAVAETYGAGSVITVEWDVANTDQPPINAQNVDILLSLDGGLTYTETLASNIQNSGTVNVQLPGLETTNTTARIMVKPSNNVFFAINSADFGITTSDFTLDFDQVEFNVCGDELEIDLVYQTYGGFNGTTTLSTDTPTGVSDNFSQTTVSETDTQITLQLTGLSVLGFENYPLVINAETGGNTTQFQLELNIVDPIFEAMALSNPQDQEVNTTTAPTFVWQAQDNADSYDIEIATDEAFTTIVERALVITNEYTSDGLTPNTLYYWRVRSNNPCTTGDFSTPFSFTTIAVDCDVFQANTLPVTISSGAPSTVSTTVSVLQDNIIQETKLNLELDHTYLSDLDITLISPQGTRVTLVSAICGELNNINAVFDDDGAAITCSGNPAISGTVRPQGSLGTFRGESTYGNWVLEIADNENQDGGQLIDFSIDFCVEGEFRPDDDDDGVFDDGDDLCLGTPEGVDVDVNGCRIYRFDPNNFTIQVDSESCSANNDGAISITAANTALTYTALLSAAAQTQTETFTETAAFTSLQQGDYRLCITGTDGTNDYEESCLDIVITEPEPLSVNAVLNEQELMLNLQLEGSTLYSIELNGVVTQTSGDQLNIPLNKGANTLKISTDLPCQGTFEDSYYIEVGEGVSPNPTQTTSTIFLDGFSGRYDLNVFGYDGKLVKTQEGTTENGAIILDLAGQPPGLYLVKIAGNQTEEIFKIIKR